MLVGVAESLDKPSGLNSFVMSRVYSIADDEDIQDIINNIDCEKYQGSVNSYVRIAGVVGGPGVPAFLSKLYIDLQDDPSKASTMFYTINSIGLAGKDTSAILLEKVLENYQAYNLTVPKHVFARSIYLITGEKTYFVDRHGQKEQLHISPKLKEIRDVLRSSQGRQRTVEERLTLDKLFQAPKQFLGTSLNK